MRRLLLRSVLVAVTLIIGFHADMAAKRPTRFVICQSAVQELPISIAVFHGDKMKDAVEHCLSFWNGVVLDIER